MFVLPIPVGYQNITLFDLESDLKIIISHAKVHTKDT